MEDEVIEVFKSEGRKLEVRVAVEGYWLAQGKWRDTLSLWRTGAVRKESEGLDQIALIDYPLSRKTLGIECLV